MQKSEVEYMFFTIYIAVIILLAGCATDPESTASSEPRWKFIDEFGKTPITELFVNSSGTQLSVTSENYFGIIQNGYTSPRVMEALQTPTHDCFRYIPFINDDCYFYCNANGDLLHIGNNLTGEFLGTIPIEDIVEEIDLPAKYNRSTDTHNSNHMEYHDGLYMISIRHEAIAQDDWLYFGEFDLSSQDVSFNISKKICSYEEPATATVIVRCNYYYGGYFWQYRTDNFSPNVCAVKAEDLSVVYTTFIPAITGIYEYYDYLLGFFDIYIKKSFDNGFTWEDWAVMNAPWVHEEIAGVNVLFYSHNLSSVDFDLLATEDYAEGELEGHCITNLIEFDGRVFAGTRDGLYYCYLEDFFIPETTIRKGNENTAKIEILQIE